MKSQQKLPRHPPSGELWKFSMDRLRELRGADTRERDLANVLGFEHSRAVRWKEGEMYVDRAEYLVRLAEVLEVDTLLVVQLAAGIIGAEQAQRRLRRGTRPDEGSKKRKGAAGAGAASGSSVASGSDGERFDPSADAGQFGTNPTGAPGRLHAGGASVVLLVSESGEGRAELAKVMDRHPELVGLVAPGLSMGIALAERYRPEVALLDLGAANVHAFEAIRVLSSLQTRANRRCRVVAGTSALTETIEKAGVMAGAAAVVLVPFPSTLFASEVDRLEERLGARKSSRR
jgi:hypothetical protein